jgi:hypothetical protein
VARASKERRKNNHPAALLVFTNKAMDKPNIYTGKKSNMLFLPVFSFKLIILFFSYSHFRLNPSTSAFSFSIISCCSWIAFTIGASRSL